MTDIIHVHNNSENPVAVPFTVGDRNRELRFVVGWNAVDPGPLDRVTGGFDAKGRAKGGLAAYLFNKAIPIRGRNLPRLELGSPRESDDVHRCPSVPGVRRHHRTLKAEKDEQEKRALTLLLEQSTRALAALRNGDDGLVEVDLGNGIKARMTMADATRYADSQSGQAPPNAAPFDPSAMTISELTDAIGAIEDAGQMRAIIAAEESSKKPRVGALEALTEALEILEA